MKDQMSEPVNGESEFEGPDCTAWKMNRQIKATLHV